MNFLDTILELVYDVSQVFPRPFETKHVWVRRMRNADRRKFDRSLQRLEERGFIQVVRRKSRKFIRITQAGELEILLKKAFLPFQGKWDGKWRLIIFDIPETSKALRHMFRYLLKRHGFYRLQHSVYIHPFPLNRKAIEYLKKTGLMSYIRILRVDSMDDDKKILKNFNLHKFNGR